MSTETQIVLKQLPVISEQLEKTGVKVRERILALDLDKQIATEDTVQVLKKTRAELNKESASMKEQLKNVISKVEEPIIALKNKFKEEIEIPYKEADELLKNKVDSVEFTVKKNKEKNVREYFDELIIAESIDFLKFENLKIDIKLSVPEKKYKEQVYDFITKVNDDLALIKTTEYQAETLTEYKIDLNVSRAITAVKARKDAEEAEKAKLKAEQRQNRENYLSKIGLNFVEITNAWEFNADIYVSLSDVINMSKEDFTEKYAEIQAKIKAFNDAQIKPELLEENKPAAEAIKQAVSAPISAPVIEKPIEEIKIASFEVKATMTKLRALGQYMKDNGIEYKNI